MSKYDGQGKYWTRDCDTCPYRVLADNTAISICRWGVAIKVLYKSADPHHRYSSCPLRNDKLPQGSAHLLDRRLPGRKLRV